MLSEGGLVPQGSSDFADALAMVRKELWASASSYGSPAPTDTVEVPQAFVERVANAVCYAT
jgi:hypothetical protein